MSSYNVLLGFRFCNYNIIAVFVICFAYFITLNASTLPTTISTNDSTSTEPALATPPPITTTNNSCFYATEDVCHLPIEVTGCKECMRYPPQSDNLVCCNVTDIEKSISCVGKVEWSNIHMRNVTVDELDISDKYWRRLNSLVITDGHINKILKDFPKFSSPKCINISNNNISSISPRAFKELTLLQVLDLSHNKLSTIPNLNLNSIPGNLSIDIR